MRKQFDLELLVESTTAWYIDIFDSTLPAAASVRE
jgi:hypothetical protein